MHNNISRYQKQKTKHDKTYYHLDILNIKTTCSNILHNQEKNIYKTMREGGGVEAALTYMLTLPIPGKAV